MRLTYAVRGGVRHAALLVLGAALLLERCFGPAFEEADPAGLPDISGEEAS